MKTKKRLDKRIFAVIIAACLAVLWVIAIALPILAATKYDLVFRDIFGEAAIETPTGGDTNVDSTYYKKDYESSAKLHEAEQAYTRKAGAEGFVLLYNSEAEGKGLPGAGGDLKLTAQGGMNFDMNNKATQYFARQAMKHVLYTTVNSNAMNGLVHGAKVPELPFAYYWLIVLAVEVITVGLTAWGVTAIVLRFKKEKNAEATGNEGSADTQPVE